MRRYAIDYQMNYDIDWFFTDGIRYFHVASNGGAIPVFLNVDRKNNMELQNRIANSKIVTEDIHVIDNPNGFNYGSFVDFAKKGFVSIDKKNDGFDSQNYVVVAEPTNKQIKPEGVDDLVPKLNEKDRFKIHIEDIRKELLW